MQLARDRQHLPAIQPNTAAVLQSNSSAALIKAENPPKGVRIGVAKLMLSFPTPGLSPADGQLLSGVYFEAVADFAPAVVIWTLNWLFFHNPRNTPTYTCPPTPQDVREACGRTNWHWQCMVLGFYLGGIWASRDYSLRRYEAIKGGKPGDPGCVVPFELQLHYLRKEIEEQLADIKAAEERTRRASSEPRLLSIEDDVFDRIPHAAFPDGVLEIIRAKRTTKAEAARQAAERQAYMASLPDEVRAVRRTVVFSEEWKDKDEPEIIAETNRRLERVRAARAEAALDGRDFLGLPFDDGTEWCEPAKPRRETLQRDPENHA